MSVCMSSVPWFLDSLDEVRSLFSLFQSHVRFAPIATLSGVAAHALHFSADVEHAHFRDFHFEQLFYRALHFELVGVGIHLESDDVCSFFAQQRALLGDQRTPDDLIRVHDCSASVSCCSAVW